MKVLWIMGLALALSGCAVSPETTIAASPFTTGIMLVSGGDCGTWRVSDGVALCQDDPAALHTERPQEIVGSEAHQVVLDGAS